MREIKEIFIHCSATDETQNFGVEDIRRWHTDPKPAGSGWSDIGYHFVITRDGAWHVGRPVEVIGAHAKGHNSDSIGVCLIGGIDSKTKAATANFTYEQYKALYQGCKDLKDIYTSIERIKGHNEVSAKDCPCFDVQSFFL